MRNFFLDITLFGTILVHLPLLFWLFAEELPLYVVFGVPLTVPFLFVFWLVRIHELETEKNPKPRQTWR